MTLGEFLLTPEGRRLNRAGWAREFEIASGYLSQLANGIKVPSLPTALLIEDRTRGKVTPYDWGVKVPQKNETV